jgi:hypothetical protein
MSEMKLLIAILLVVLAIVAHDQLTIWMER